MGAKFGKRRYVFQIFGQEEKLLPRALAGVLLPSQPRIIKPDDIKLCTLLELGVKK